MAFCVKLELKNLRINSLDVTTVVAFSAPDCRKAHRSIQLDRCGIVFRHFQKDPVYAVAG